MFDLTFQGALRLRGTMTPMLNTDTLTEVTSAPTGEDEKFPTELITSLPTEDSTQEDDHSYLTYHGGYPDMQESYEIPIRDKGRIEAYFTEMTDIPYSRYLHIAHDLNGFNKSEDRIKVHGIN